MNLMWLEMIEKDKNTSYNWCVACFVLSTIIDARRAGGLYVWWHFGSNAILCDLYIVIFKFSHRNRHNASNENNVKKDYEITQLKYIVTVARRINSNKAIVNVKNKNENNNKTLYMIVYFVTVLLLHCIFVL